MAGLTSKDEALQMFNHFKFSRMALEAAEWQMKNYPEGSEMRQYWGRVGREIARLISEEEECKPS